MQWAAMFEDEVKASDGPHALAPPMSTNIYFMPSG